MSILFHLVVVDEKARWLQSRTQLLRRGRGGTKQDGQDKQDGVVSILFILFILSILFHLVVVDEKAEWLESRTQLLKRGRGRTRQDGQDKQDGVVSILFILSILFHLVVVDEKARWLESRTQLLKRGRGRTKRDGQDKQDVVVSILFNLFILFHLVVVDEKARWLESRTLLLLKRGRGRTKQDEQDKQDGVVSILFILFILSILFHLVVVDEKAKWPEWRTLLLKPGRGRGKQDGQDEQDEAGFVLLALLRRADRRGVRVAVDGLAPGGQAGQGEEPLAGALLATGKAEALPVEVERGRGGGGEDAGTLSVAQAPGGKGVAFLVPVRRQVTGGQDQAHHVVVAARSEAPQLGLLDYVVGRGDEL